MAILAAPLPAEAQQAARVYRIGILGDTPGPQWKVFRQGLGDLGWIEGQSIEVEVRWSEGRNDRLPDLAGELVRLRVDVIVTEGSTPTQTAKKATATIPIVMAIAADPIGFGLVASLARPGGNVTGSSFLSPQLTAKQTELLKDSFQASAGSRCSGTSPIRRIGLH